MLSKSFEIEFKSIIFKHITQSVAEYIRKFCSLVTVLDDLLKADGLEISKNAYKLAFFK